MSRYPIAALGLVAAALTATSALAQDVPPVSEDTALDIVASTVRSQGHACDKPERAVRDPAASAPDEAAWIIDCANARYRVRYDNDVPATITPLD
jgi:hypothetical protein